MLCSTSILLFYLPTLKIVWHFAFLTQIYEVSAPTGRFFRYSPTHCEFLSWCLYFSFKNTFRILLHGFLLVLACRRDELQLPIDTKLRSVRMTGLGGEWTRIFRYWTTFATHANGPGRVQEFLSRAAEKDLLFSVLLISAVWEYSHKVSAILRQT